MIMRVKPPNFIWQRKSRIYSYSAHDTWNFTFTCNSLFCSRKLTTTKSSINADALLMDAPFKYVAYRLSAKMSIHLLFRLFFFIRNVNEIVMSSSSRDSSGFKITFEVMSSAITLFLNASSTRQKLKFSVSSFKLKFKIDYFIDIYIYILFVYSYFF